MWRAAQGDVRRRPLGPVPPELRDALNRGAGGLGHGVGYEYPHDDPRGFVEAVYLPEGLLGRRYYEPSQHGAEKGGLPSAGGHGGAEQGSKARTTRHSQGEVRREVNADQLRNTFTKFFVDRGHLPLPAASLVPNDPTMLPPSWAWFSSSLTSWASPRRRGPGRRRCNHVLRAVTLFLPGFPLPRAIAVTADPAPLGEAEIVVSVIPSEFLRSHARPAPSLRFIPGRSWFPPPKASENNTCLRMTQVIASSLGVVAPLPLPRYAKTW